jgi:drug/metabolite transporter (DMT)-like permease
LEGFILCWQKLSWEKTGREFQVRLLFLVGIILLIKLELYEGGLYADLWIMGISLAIIAIFIWAIYVLICSKEVKEAFLINKN